MAKHRIWLLTGEVGLLAVLCCCAEEVKSSPAAEAAGLPSVRALVGAYYFDGWAGPNPQGNNSISRSSRGW